MTSLSKFYESQKFMGRAGLVAACIAMMSVPSITQARAEEPQTFTMTQNVNGSEIEKTLPRTQLHAVLAQMNDVVSRDLKVVGVLNNDLDKIGASHLSVDQKITEIKKVANAALAKLDSDKTIRLSHERIQTGEQNDSIKDADVLATRSNRLVEFAGNVTMTLKAMIVALDQHDVKGIDQAYRALDRLYGEQMSIEAGLGQMGFSVDEALKQVR